MTMMTSSYFFLKKEKTSQNFRYMWRTHKEVLLLDKKEWDEIEENLYIYIFIYNMIDREIYYRDVDLFKKLMAIDKVKKNKQKYICFIIFWRKKN